MIGIYLALVVGAGLLTLFITHFADYDIKLPRFMRSKQKEEPTPDSDRARVVAVCRKCAHHKFNTNCGVICGITNKPGDFGDDCQHFFSERNYREQILTSCRICAHHKSDPERGVICGFTDKLGDFNGECEYFHHENEYTARRRAEANIKGFENEQIGVLTKWDIQSTLSEAGYTITEEQEPEAGQYFARFSVAEGVSFVLFYNGAELMVNYNLAVEIHTGLAHIMANKLMDDMIAIKIYVEKIPEDSTHTGLKFAIETFVRYADELQFQFPAYIDCICEAARRFGALMDEFNSDENKRRRNIYNREFFRFSDLVDAVTDGQCGDGAFTDEEWLREGLRRDCDEEYKSAWDEFKILQATKYGNYKLIVYRFPEPKVMPEALYGAVLLNTTTHKADYYTLEYSFNGKWVLGSTSRGKHSNYGEVDTPDLEQFIAWIFNSNKQLCYYTDMYGHETQKVN